MERKPLRETVFLWPEIRTKKGGWKDMRLSLAVLSTMTQGLVFDESNVGSLLYLLRNAPVVVCYDPSRDLKLLERYNKFASLADSLRFVDLRRAIEQNCDFRPFFPQTAAHTLGSDVTLDKDVGALMKAGHLQEAISVAELRGITLRDLYLFVSTNRFVSTQHKDGGEVKKVKVESDFLQPNYFHV